MKYDPSHWRLALLLLSLLFSMPLAAGTAQSLNQAIEAATRGDFAVAYCILKPLADRGQPDAQYHLGWMFANGEGLALDEEKAVKLWQLAARQGHEEAQFRVAMAYLHGEGVKRNIGQAVEWLHQLALRGDDDSREMLLQLVREDEPSAREIFKKWLETGSKALGKIQVVGVERANLRKGAGKDHAVVKVLKQGARLVEIDRSGAWVNVGVLGDGTIAWLHESLLAEEQRQ